MTIEAVRAEIGQWYLRPDNGDLFRVVALDERSHMIEIQSFEGDLDELDAEALGTLHLTRCSEPESWIGPMDDIETDDRNGLTGRSLTDRDLLALLQTDGAIASRV